MFIFNFCIDYTVFPLIEPPGVLLEKTIEPPGVLLEKTIEPPGVLLEKTIEPPGVLLFRRVRRLATIGGGCDRINMIIFVQYHGSEVDPPCSKKLWENTVDFGILL